MCGNEESQWTGLREETLRIDRIYNRINLRKLELSLIAMRWSCCHTVSPLNGRQTTAR